MRAASSTGIPEPLSQTSTTTAPSRRAIETSMRAGSSDIRTEFSNRLENTWIILSMSSITRGTPGSLDTVTTTVRPGKREGSHARASSTAASTEEASSFPGGRMALFRDDLKVFAEAGIVSQLRLQRGDGRGDAENGVSNLVRERRDRLHRSGYALSL